MQKNTETNIMGTCVTTPELQVLPLPYLLHLFFFKKRKKCEAEALHHLSPSPLPRVSCISFSVPAFVLLLYYNNVYYFIY